MMASTTIYHLETCMIRKEVQKADECKLRKIKKANNCKKIVKKI